MHENKKLRRLFHLVNITSEAEQEALLSDDHDYEDKGEGENNQQTKKRRNRVAIQLVILVTRSISTKKQNLYLEKEQYQKVQNKAVLHRTAEDYSTKMTKIQRLARFKTNATKKSLAFL